MVYSKKFVLLAILVVVGTAVAGSSSSVLILQVWGQRPAPPTDQKNADNEKQGGPVAKDDRSTASDAQTSSVQRVTSAEEDDPSLPFVTFGKSIAPADPATDKDKPPRPEDALSATAWEMVILPDGQTLVTRDSYTQVVHRDLKTGRMTRSMKSPDRLNFAILEICPRTGGFLSTDAKTLSEPQLKDSQLMADLKEHFSRVEDTCFSANGERVAVLLSAHHARVYDRRSGKLLRQFGAPPTLDYSRPGCITLSADGKHVAYSSSRKDR